MPNYTITDEGGAVAARLVADTADSKPTDVQVSEEYAFLQEWVDDVMKGDTGNSPRALTRRMGYDMSLSADDEGEQVGDSLEAKIAAARARVAKREDEAEEDLLRDEEDGEVEKAEFGTYDTIVKADDEQQIVYGWAYVTHDKDGNVVVDKSGEFVDDIAEIEKTAVQFMLESRRGDVHHTNVHTTDIVESMVFTPEKMEKMGIEKGTLPSGWWIGAKCSDEVWAEYKAGRLKAFSVHGKGLKKAV